MSTKTGEGTLSDAPALSTLTAPARVDTITSPQAIIPQSENSSKSAAAGPSKRKEVPQDIPTTSSNFPRDILVAEKSKKPTKLDTFMDAVETGLHVVSKVTDFIPGPAGPIVKLMVGSGLTIIDILNVGTLIPGV